MLLNEEMTSIYRLEANIIPPNPNTIPPNPCKYVKEFVIFLANLEKFSKFESNILANLDICWQNASGFLIFQQVCCKKLTIIFMHINR